MREGFFLLAVTFLAEAASVSAQPTIQHQGLRCVPRDSFTQYLAEIAPPGSIRSAKLYFRSGLYPDFYFVEMAAGSSGYGGTVPLPSAETSTIVYYIEAVDASFQTARSQEFEVDVTDGTCGPGPGALLYTGAPPGIVVGATQASMSALPLGFQATGITGFVSAAGISAGTAGSGIGAGVALGAAAGAAAGVGVLVASASDEGTAETSSPPPPASPANPTSGPPDETPPSAPAGPTPPPDAPEPPTPPTEPPPGPSDPNAPPTEPPPTEPPGPPPPPPPPPLPPDAPTACFTWTPIQGTCQVHFDAGCSRAPAGGAQYDWRMLGPPVAAPPTARAFTFDFAGDPRCSGGNAFNRPVRLTVTDSEGRNDSVQQNVSVQPGASSYAFATEEPTTIRFTSRIHTPAGEAVPVEGWVSANGSMLGPTPSTAAREYEVRTSADRLRIEAAVSSAVPEGTLWELDFSASASGAAVSVVESGTAVVVEPHRLIFRLSGAAGETIRFYRTREE